MALPDGVIKRRIDPGFCADIMALAKRELADGATYRSASGALYIRRLWEYPLICDLVLRPDLVGLARPHVGSGALGVLSLAALRVEPGEDGVPPHRDWPHGQDDPDDAPQLCAPYVLSLDGTTGDRAPLWLRHPETKIVLEPGDLISCGGNILHGVHPNRGDGPRTSLLWSIGPLWVRPMFPELWLWQIR